MICNMEAAAQTEVEITNDLIRSTLRAAVHAITRGDSEKGHTRLTIEFQDGEVRRAFVERTLGGTDLVAST